MMRSMWPKAAVLVLLAAGCAHQEGAQVNREDEPRESGVQPAVEPDILRAKIARYARVRIPYHPEELGAAQREAVDLLVEASRVIDDLFWEQASEEGPRLRRRLADPDDPVERMMAHYLAINYGPYDRLDGMEPFIQVPPRPPGATFYPRDMSKDEFNSWIEEHPEDKQAFQSWFTVIRRKSDHLVAVPYAECYRDKLARAARLLEQAAARVENESLARFLRSRAAAFSSNNYRASDKDWMDVRGAELEVTIGPYEVYEDHLFNYKAAFESFVTIRSAEQSRKLDKLGSYLDELESNLPLPDEHKNFERGASSPFVVADLIYAAGDTRAGVQTLAFNLPNDEQVREEKGCKKVMLKNISQAKFDKILVPIAERVIAADQRDRVTFDAYFNHTLMHEISHGLGPGRIEHDGEKVPVSLLLKDQYAAIEEAKADVLGVYNTLYLVDRGVLDKNLRTQCPVTFLAGVFRSVRFGVHESHGRANLIAFNYLLDQGAYRHDPDTGRFRVEPGRFGPAVESLARTILLLQARGDYQGARDFIERYATIRPPMRAALDTLGDIPVDIEPVFDLDKEA